MTRPYRTARPSRGFIPALRAVLASLVALALTISFAVGRAAARDLSSEVVQQISAILAEKDARTPAQRKLDSHLVYAVKRERRESLGAGVPELRNTIERNAQGDTEVDIRATVTPELLEALVKLGAVIESSFPEYDAIRARIALEALEDAAALEAVHHIEPALPPYVHKANTSEGDVTHRANQVRTNLGFQGAGVTVGVLSDSNTNLATVQAQGDLPPTCPAGPPCVSTISGQGGSGAGEGTAMMEIVNDLAPAANLIFATANGGQAQFATNITALRTAGCKVIVDDVSYAGEAVFQDGTVAQAVNAARAAGAVYFSSAANAGNKNDGTAGAWEGDYASGTKPAVIPGSGTAHDFGGGVVVNTATKDSPFVFELQWSDAFGASGNDYDFFEINAAETSVLDQSTNVQDGNDNPVEIIDSRSFNDVNQKFVIVKRDGAANRFLHLGTYGGRMSFNTPGTTAGHNAAEKAVTVAAVPVSSAGCPSCGPFVGGATNPVETFSSDGPRKVFYDANGNAITPGNLSSTGGKVLNKPDLAAADGVACLAPGFNPFFGTSAAAPHAAAIAALILSAHPAFTPDQTEALLKSSTLDIEGTGFDRDSGSGVVNALLAFDAVSLDAIGSPLHVGSQITLTGTGITPGSVLKVFLATSSGLVDAVPSGIPATSTKGTSWTGTLPFPWPLAAPKDTTLGNGFASLVLVRTDRGFDASSAQPALLFGNDSLSVPTITAINGTALSATSSDPNIGTANVEGLLVRNANNTITGSAFASPVVNVFTASGNAGPISPSLATSTSLTFFLPSSAPIGPGSLQVVNTTNFRVSNSVSIPIGELVSVSSVQVNGATITVNGTGFNALTVINLFAKSGGNVINAGGLTGGGTPKIPLNIVNAHQFTFTRPGGLDAGKAYVAAINPPFIPFTSSGTGPGGSFTLP